MARRNGDRPARYHPPMRIVLAANPGIGHLLPLLPIASVARAAGHDVTFLGGAALAPVLAAHGFRLVDAGPPDLRSVFSAIPEAVGQTGKRHAALIWARGFGGIVAPATAAALLELARTWLPDLVLHDDSEQGTWIAAERLGIPHVALQATAWRSAGIRLSAEPLGRLIGSLGVLPDPGLARWHRHGFLATRPASLQDPADPLPPTAVALRPESLDGLGEDAQAWPDGPRADRPRVAVTLGTILPGRLDTIAAVLDGLAALDVDVVAAVGPGVDPAALGPRPAAIRVVPYVPMSRLLAGCDALVFHAGSGTMLTALSQGVPLVMLPVAADQPENAERCVVAGAGISLGPADRDPASIAAAVRRVLGDTAFSAGAGRVRLELQAMPGPEALLPRLEALAAAGRDGVLEPA